MKKRAEGASETKNSLLRISANKRRYKLLWHSHNRISSYRSIWQNFHHLYKNYRTLENDLSFIIDLL